MRHRIQAVANAWRKTEGVLDRKTPTGISGSTNAFAQLYKTPDTDRCLRLSNASIIRSDRPAADRKLRDIGLNSYYFTNT